MPRFFGRTRSRPAGATPPRRFGAGARSTLASALPRSTPVRRHVGWLLVLVVGIGGGAQAATSDPVYEVFRTQLAVQQRLVADQLGALQDHQAAMEAAWSRVDQLASDLVRAQQDHESLDSLRLRSEDLQQAESDLAMRLLEGQQLRLALTEKRALVDQLRAELKRLEQLHAKPLDPLSGTWRITVEPGGQEGVLFLDLEARS